MNKKGIISLVSAGLLASTLSVQSVQADTNKSESVSKKLIDQHMDKPLQKKNLNQRVLNDLKSDATHSLEKAPSLSSSQNSKQMNSSSANDDPLFEKEPNNDFNKANSLPNEKTIIGQMLPMYDVDFYKVNVPAKGALLVAGTTNSPAIDLAFTAAEKDFKDNKNLIYQGSDYSDGVEVQVYQVNKSGTYYIGATDYEFDDYDDNTVDDLYALSTAFVDNVAPDKPAVNKVGNNDKVVTGKAEASSTVTVKAGSKTLGSAKTSSKGTFSVNISVQKAGTTLTVTAKDSAGNVSPSVSTKVADVVAPNKPTVNKVDDNDKVVTGKAEASSTVTVKAGSKSLGSAKASSKGTYSVKIPAQKAGTTLTVTAKDVAGNVSSGATTKVVKH
ncbi:Ig-like domain-containing protein [Priestia megaterium]|uniref:Ig-like domain-containing protein n=1 Tax=Priestia megaterium TaxID=1404 RepID=UPI00296FE67E|nr:Ig-like domain-containing protein [Priestia megaterium]MDW4509052.1 Ig-like domain-containing protein [Priestia megaterium]